MQKRSENGFGRRDGAEAVFVFRAANGGELQRVVGVEEIATKERERLSVTCPQSHSWRLSSTKSPTEGLKLPAQDGAILG
jgi:hypothetical protein